MGNLELKGRMADLKQKKMSLAIKAQGYIRGLKGLLATATIDPLEEVRANEIESLAGQLAETKREYAEVLDMVRECEKELA